MFSRPFFDSDKNPVCVLSLHIMGAFLRDIRIISLLMCIRQTYSDGSILNIFKNSPGQNLQIKFGPMGLDLSLQRLRCGKNKTNLAVILVLNLAPELGKDRVRCSQHFRNKRFMRNEIVQCPSSVLSKFAIYIYLE